MTNYDENLIKVYESDLTELMKDKKVLIKKLAEIEREIIKKRMFIKQIRGEC